MRWGRQGGRRDPHEGQRGIPTKDKGDASSRLQASEGPAGNEEKREVVEKLKERGS